MYFLKALSSASWANATKDVPTRDQVAFLRAWLAVLPLTAQQGRQHLGSCLPFSGHWPRLRRWADSLRRRSRRQVCRATGAEGQGSARRAWASGPLGPRCDVSYSQGNWKAWKGVEWPWHGLRRTVHPTAIPVSGLPTPGSGPVTSSSSAHEAGLRSHAPRGSNDVHWMRFCGTRSRAPCSARDAANGF